MAFGRSNSLSINTAGGGLFGGSTTATQTTQPATSGGLFGSTLGGAGTAASQPSSTPSLFGGATATATNSAAPATSSLFGAAQPATQSAAAPSTSLFGAKPAAAAAPTSSLFGGGAAQTQTQTQPQTQTNSLFGATATQTQSQPQQNSLFGGQSTAPALGAAAAAQPVQTTLESMRGTTRFNELHPELQTLIQQFDEGIQRKIGYCSQIRETLPNSEKEVATIAPDVAYVEQALSTVEIGLDNDSANIARLRDLVKKDAADAMLSFRAIENQRLPAQFHYRNSANLTAPSTGAAPASSLDDDDPTKPVDLMAYFTRRTSDLDRTLEVYQRQIREIEGHLRTMEAGTLEKAAQLTGSRSAPRDQRRELVDALRAIEGAILDAAKKVGKVRDDVTKQTMGHVGATLL